MSWAVLVLLDSLNHACKVAKDVLMVSQSKIKAYFGKDAIKRSVLMFAIDSINLNPAKCEFAKAILTYLGKYVGQGKVHPVKITATVEFPIPATVPNMKYLVLVV